MPLLKTEGELVDRFSDSQIVGTIAIAYLFKDGEIVTSEHQPCHQGFGATTCTQPFTSRISQFNKKQKDIVGAYVKLGYANPTLTKECDEAWYDMCFNKGRNFPWRHVKAEILTRKGKYIAGFIPEVATQEAQPWVNMCFATRAPYQRPHVTKFWYDLVTKHGFHPTEALFVISFLCYSFGNANTVVKNTLSYDWLFKGNHESVVSFDRLWNSNPNITRSCFLPTLKHFGMPNEIWIEDNKKLAARNALFQYLQKKTEYTGSLSRAFYSNQLEQITTFPSLKECATLIRKEISSWPR